MNGLTKISVFDPEVFKPGSGVWLSGPVTSRRVGIVTYFSYTELKVSTFRSSSGKVVSSTLALDDVLHNGYTIEPIKGDAECVN